jgi:hypothetical protein
MPEFEKLSKEEVKNLLMAKEKGRGLSKREQILRAYMEQLQGLDVGEGLEIKLQPTDNRQTVKNRLLRAADRLGIEIEFIRSRNVIRLYRTK